MINIMRPRTNMITVNKGFIILCNVIAFAIALQAVDISMGSEVGVDNEIVAPRDAMIPHITITNKTLVSTFMEGLGVDHKFNRPRHIAECIYPWDNYIRGRWG